MSHGVRFPFIAGVYPLRQPSQAESSRGRKLLSRIAEPG